MGPTKTRIKLFIDVDGTIINTAETFIDKYCKENNINKIINDLKDWEFKSIDRKMHINEFLRYIETEEFFKTIELDENFLKFYVMNEDKYEWIFITKGTRKNLELKERFLRESLPTLNNVKYIGIENEDKKNYNMKNGIQIDDNIKNLDTNARFKILIKNYLDTDYNRIQAPSDDIYEMNNWNEIAESIEWFRKEILDIVKV